ncbi:MAG TPA: FAD-dependent monooxygenase, partial [Thermoanaerobaculia bacterium]|nr:FAD-dependent monooxygenase [Thermoanaerobaculia bacterium]
RHALHIWPCGDHLMFALPNFDGSLCGVCVLPFEGRHSFDALKTDREILDLFETYFGDALPYMPNAVEEFKTRPISEFITVRTSLWHYKDKVLLIGDAAHSVVPFYGQGMNAAFEDAATINRLLDRYGESNWAAMLREFQKLRKPNTDVLAQLSIDNFDELRDTVRSPIVTARKRTSIFLNRLFRQHSVPLYTMVSHSCLPYTECVERHRRQERIARWLGLDLVLGAVALQVKVKTAIANRRAARLAQGRAAVPTVVAVPLPEMETTEEPVEVGAGEPVAKS